MTIIQDIYQEYSISRIHSDWACMMGQDYMLNDNAFRSDTFEYARQMMRRARECILRLIDGLQKKHYRFVDESSVFIEPEHNINEWVVEYRERNIHIPLAVQAWLCEVGNVNLMGSHPDWPSPAYIFDNGTTGEPLYTDPLVVELTKEHIDYFYDEWQSDAERSTEPFRLEIAPDYIHKANVSGGLPYEITADVPKVDSIVFNERHCTTFVHYIRLALYWRGFPGFEYINCDHKGIKWNTDETMII